MSVTRSAARWGSARLLRRAQRSVPFLGAALAILAIGGEMRRKGVVRGAVNLALDATPFLGAAKNMIEVFRGDFIPDRPRRVAGLKRGPTSGGSKDPALPRDLVRAGAGM